MPQNQISDDMKKLKFKLTYKEFYSLTMWLRDITVTFHSEKSTARLALIIVRETASKLATRLAVSGLYHQKHFVVNLDEKQAIAIMNFIDTKPPILIPFEVEFIEAFDKAFNHTKNLPVYE